MNNAVELLNNYMKDYYEEILKNRAVIALEDGLKPIQRKLLYSFYDKGHTSGKPFTKSATSVGEVLRFSPHSDSAAYEAAVNMSCFMNTVPLLELHGGNKTIYGSNSSAPRYTELRTSKFSDFVLLDKVDKKYNSVNYVPNFDESLTEPEYLPAKFPVFLLNGTLGLAGGFMCSMLPHSIDTIVNKTIQLIDNPDIEIDDFIKDFLPTFPTGGILANTSAVRKSYKVPASIENRTNGTCIARAKIKYEEKNNYIKIYEVPYYITVDKIVDSIKLCIKENIITEINSIKDLSAGGKVDIRIYLKRGSDSNAVIGKLYKNTSCQNSIPISNIVTYKGNLKIYNNIKEMLFDWIEFRINTLRRIHNEIIKDLNYNLHIKEGLLIICENPKNIDKLLEIIRNKKYTNEEIFEKVKETFSLSNKQTEYILSTKIINLSNVNISDLKKDIDNLNNEIEKEIAYISNESNFIETIKSELIEIKKKFGKMKFNGNDFTTEYQEINLNSKLIIEERIPDEDYIFILSKFGFLKKIKVNGIKSQVRRGVGDSIGQFKEGDSPLCNIVCNSKDNIFLFTSDGMSYRYKAYNLPSSENINNYGKTIKHLVENKDIVSIVAVSDEEFNDDNNSFITLSKNGKLKATMMSEFMSRSNLLATKLVEGDELKFVTTCNLLDVTNKYIVIANKAGYILKNEVSEIKISGRITAGNDSFSMTSTKEKGREILSCEIIEGEQNLVFVYSNGLIKRCSYENFPVMKFRTQGCLTGIKENSELVTVISYQNENDIISIISNKKSINIRISDIPMVNRTAFGSKAKKLEDDEYIVNAILLNGENIKKKEMLNKNKK